MGTELEDGWEYWTRVYSDAALRNQFIALHQDEPYLSKILSDEKLRKTKVIIEHLPRTCSNQELKNLLEEKIGCGKIMTVRIMGCRGLVTFYQVQDAETVLEAFEGRIFRGYRLMARLDPGPERAAKNTCEDKLTDTPTPIISLDDQLCYDKLLDQSSAPSAELQNIPKSPSLTSLNGGCSGAHETFLRALTALLAKGPLRYTDSQITSLLLRQSPNIQLPYFCWPLGAFRTRTNLPIVGPYICLPQDEEMVAHELNAGQALLSADRWEPMAPSEIWNNSDLAKYTQAFLKHFGPSWLWDVPFDYLVKSLPCWWRRQRSELAEIIERELPEVVCLYDTLYLTTVTQHRLAAARAIRRGPN